MHIALINPPFLFPARGEIVFSHLIGLRSLSAVLKRDGHQVWVLDALMQGFDQVFPYANGFQVGLPLPEIAKMIPADVDLIGVSVPFSQLAPVAHELIAVIRQRFPQTLIVMGGVYPSTQPELAVTSKADYILIGEGEIALAALAAGSPPAEIAGLIACSGSLPPGPATHAERPADLDSLPFPDYDIPDMSRYFAISPRQERGRTAALVTSRGCPFDCEFCSVHPVCGHKWRARSADNVLQEIEYLVKKHQISVIEFEDDNFTLKQDRAARILEGIIRINESGAPLFWKTPNGIRIDTLDAEFIGLMKRAGCSHLVLALEHGDREMLRIMNKKLDLDRAFGVIEAAVKHQIPEISLFFIVGYPGETRERFESARRFLRRVRTLGGNITAVANMAQPYPGTKLLERCLREGFIADPDVANFLVRKDLFSTEHVVGILTPDFDAKEVKRRKRVIADFFTPKWKRLLKTILPWSLVTFISRLKRGRVSLFGS